MDHPGPRPDPSGARQPPGWLPPTAIGAATLPPEEPVRRRVIRQPGILAAIRRLLDRVLS